MKRILFAVLVIALCFAVPAEAQFTGGGSSGSGSGASTASDVANVPAGDIEATDVQAAIDELDTEKAATGSFGGDAGAGGTTGLVPAPAAGDAAAGKYLDADGTWTTPPDTDTTYSDFVGDAGAGGTAGLVPAPGVGEATYVLFGNGTWAALSGVSLDAANTWTRGQTIDGTVDEPQLTVQGHSTQTGPLQEWENSAGTVVATLSVSGNRGAFRTQRSSANNCTESDLQFGPTNSATTGFGFYDASFFACANGSLVNGWNSSVNVFYKPPQLVDPGTAPTCDASYRGTLWFDAGAGGVTDELFMCMKAAADTYSWVSIKTGG